MLSKKIILSAALVSMAGLVACGDDSSSNSGSNTKLPEKVKTIREANSLKCDESVKCEKVFVEEEIVNDYFQCDGSQWFPATDAKFETLCPAEGKKAEGEEKEEGKEGKTPDSSASNGESSDSSTGESSDSSTGESSDSNTTSADSNTSSTDSNGSSTDSGSGEMVSCNVPSDVPGMDTCMEFPAGSAEATAVQAQCESVYLGTLGNGCPK